MSNLNTLASLGTCHECREVMSPEDFLSTTLIKVMGMTGYACTNCIAKFFKDAVVEGPPKHPNCKAIVETSSYKCITCAYESDDITEYLVKKTNTIKEGKVVSKDWHYCMSCVQKFGLK